MPGKSHEMNPQLPVAADALMTDLRQIIDSARMRVASTANYELTMMYWHIGERINRDVLANQRAEYGKQIVATVAQQLQAHYGTRGFDEKSIRRMMQFASVFLDEKIVAPLARQLSWSHFLEVIPMKDALQREFYLTMAASERWSKRLLREKIDGMLYERTAIATKPDELIRKELAELRDDNTLSPDLVFILCTEGGEEQIELLQLDKAGIKVAQYLTELPPREVLLREIQNSFANVKGRLENELMIFPQEHAFVKRWIIQHKSQLNRRWRSQNFTHIDTALTAMDTDRGLNSKMIKPLSFAFLGLLYLTQTLQTEYLSHEHHNELDVSTRLASSVTLAVFSV